MNGEDEKELKMQSFGEAESVYGDEEEEEEEGMASMQGDSYHDRDRPSYDDFMKDRDNAADADALGDGVADTSNADDDDNEAEIMNDADCSDEADADECSDDVDGGRAEAGNHADGLEIGFENTLKNKHAPLVWDVNLDTDGLTQLAQLIETELEGVEMVYFLVSLPFYEQEWEMERWIIEQIFGSVSEEDMEAMEAGEHAAAAAGADGAGDSDDGDIDAVDDDNTSDAGEK